jgi:hypothetical protein
MPWTYESARFTLSDGTTYIPDFYLVEEDRHIEIKGHLTDAAKRKLGLFRKEYPRIRFKIVDKSAYEYIERIWSERIPNWEKK